MNPEKGAKSATTTTKEERPEKFLYGPSQGTEYWHYGIFNCFDDIRICIAGFCCPCYLLGKNAVHFDEEGLAVGALYCIGMIPLATVLRWRLREEKDIRGSMIADTVVSFLLPCCAIIQEHKEIYGVDGERIPIVSDITRQ